MRAVLSLLRLRSEAEAHAALRAAWSGVYDIERDGREWRAYCLREPRRPVTGRTLRKLNAAIVADWTSVMPRAPRAAA